MMTQFLLLFLSHFYFYLFIFYKSAIWLRTENAHHICLWRTEFWLVFSGPKNRLGIESGYSSLEKTSPLVGGAQTHTDSRCASVCSPSSQSFMFPTSKSSCSYACPSPTHNSTQFSGDPEDVVCSSWDRKGLESIGERHASMTHTSRTHPLRHNAHQARSSGRKAHRLFGNQHR